MHEKIKKNNILNILKNIFSLSLPGARYFLIIDNVRTGDLINGLAELIRLDCPVGEVESF